MAAPRVIVRRCAGGAVELVLVWLPVALCWSIFAWPRVDTGG
jgi:hypothetical protein